MRKKNESATLARIANTERLYNSITGQHRVTELCEKLSLSPHIIGRYANELCSEGRLKRTQISGILFYAKPDHLFDETPLTRTAIRKKTDTFNFNPMLTKAW